MGDTSGDCEDELDDFFPPYLQKDSPWADRWKRQNPGGWRRPAPSAPKQHSTIKDPHYAAAVGDVDRLKEIAEKNKKLLHKPDENGWHPLHEAVRSGHADAAKLLVQHGANVNQRTGRKGTGPSPLNIALEYHSKTSPIVKYLKSLGAEDISDEL